MNYSTFPILRCLAFGLLFAPVAAYAALPPDVLAKNRWTQVTRADYDVALARVPAKMRFEFSMSPKRVQDLLNNLLLNKTLAAQGAAHGAKPAPSFGKDTTSGEPAERELAEAELKRIEADASQSFDSNRAGFEQKAREIYQVDPESYRTPEEARVSDIAVLIKDRGDDAARKRAGEARAKIAAGADFATVAREYSDDPTTKQKGGALPFVSAKRLAPSFAKAVFSLKPGELSEPIKAPMAYHIVRVEERRPSRLQSFEEVHQSIMDKLRASYVKEQRDQRIQSIYQDPTLETNQPAIDALVTSVDPERLKSPPAAVTPPSK